MSEFKEYQSVCPNCEVEMTVRSIPSELSEAFDNLKDNNLDCGDHSCLFALDKTGQRTNGGCTCFSRRKEVTENMRRFAITAARLLKVWENDGK